MFPTCSDIKKVDTIPCIYFLECPEPESNQWHEDFQSSALPTELSGRITSQSKTNPNMKLRWKLVFISSGIFGLQFVALATNGHRTNRRFGRWAVLRIVARWAVLRIVARWAVLRIVVRWAVLPNYKAVAGIGFEPMTFGLWARRASRLLHPALL